MQMLRDEKLNGHFPSGVPVFCINSRNRDTDLYIFRESDGSLIAQREGLTEEAVEEQRWEALLRGEMASTDMNRVHVIGSQPPLEFASRHAGGGAGMPGPGEQLQVVAINRPTGYVASERFTLEGDGEESVVLEGPALVLRPPNLKVFARRFGQIEQGLTRDETLDLPIPCVSTSIHTVTV